MSDAQEPVPSEPGEFGVPEDTAPQMEIESAQLLANEAREELRDRGFDDRQIDDWANAFVSRIGTGDRERFIAWIEDEQS